VDGPCNLPATFVGSVRPQASFVGSKFIERSSPTSTLLSSLPKSQDMLKAVDASLERAVGCSVMFPLDAGWD
jgi:hypothetical protein